MPTPYPEPTPRAEPEAASEASSPILVQGPVTLAGLEPVPDATKMPWSTDSSPAACTAGDWTTAYSLLPSAE